MAFHNVRHKASEHDDVLNIKPCTYGVIRTHGGELYEVVYRYPSGEWSYAKGNRASNFTKKASEKYAKELNAELEDMNALDANECPICHKTSCSGPSEHR